MQVIFLPSDQLPCFGSGPCLRLGGVLYCDYEVLKLPAHKIRAVLIAHRLKPEKEVVRTFGLRGEGRKMLVVARSIMAPLNEVSRLQEFQFRIAGKWWEVVYGVEAGFSGPGFSGLLSGPEFTGFTGSISRELTLSGYPEVRRELSEGQPFDLPWLESRSPDSSLAISEDLLLARLQKKLRLLKGVKRLRNRQEWKATLDKVQLGLDVAGMVPVIGNAADLLNLCISLGRGNYGEAAMNAVSMLPGSQVVTGAKLAIRSGRRWRKAGRMRIRSGKRNIPKRSTSNRNQGYKRSDRTNKNVKISTEEWIEDFNKKPAAGKAGSEPRIFQERVAGTIEYEVKNSSGDKIWVDGVDIENDCLLEAKYVGKVGNSPFVADSKMYEPVRKKILDEVEDEIYRYSKIIKDPSTPVKELVLIVSKKEAIPYFNSLLIKYNLQGKVVVK